MRIKKVSLILALIMLFSVFMGVFAFADTTNINQVVVTIPAGTNLGATADYTVRLRSGMTVDSTQTSSDGKYNLFVIGSDKVTLDKDVFSASSYSEKKKAIRLFVKRLEESKLSNSDQQSIYNALCDDSDIQQVMLPIIMDSTKADLFAAQKVTKPFQPIVQVTIGIAVIVVLSFFMLSTACDLFYIGVPYFQNMADDAGAKSSKGKIPLLSLDAIETVKESHGQTGQGGGGYQNPYWIYGKRRAVTIIIIAFCITYLIGGGMGNLIGGLLSLTGGR